MDCHNYPELAPGTIREQMRQKSFGADEFDVLMRLKHKQVILGSQGLSPNFVLSTLICWGWIESAIFEDGDTAYKAKSEVMLEFEQLLREDN